MRVRSLLPALMAAVTLPVSALPLVAGPVAGQVAAASTPAPVTQPVTQPAEEEQSPLHLTLRAMTPSVLPTSGPMRLRGTVTNVSDEPWTTVNIYPFASWTGVEPTVITSPAQLAQEAARAPEEAVGERFTDPDNYRTIEELAPGQTARYTATITAEQIEAVTQQGVYWVGVHALGQSDSVPRDGFADGRARTFVPLVGSDASPVPTSLVASIRGGVRYAPDGSVDDLERWAARLTPGGRLGRLLTFGEASPLPITWLVDPSVPDAIQRLADANPPRSLSPNRTGPDEPEEAEETPEPSESTASDPAASDPTASDPGDTDSGSSADATPEAEPTETDPSETDPSETDPSETDPSETEGDPEADPQVSATQLQAAEAAADWLDRTGDVLAGSEILLLPFGDTDVSAAINHDPGWYTRTRERSGSVLEPWKLPGSPSIAAPDGLISPEAIAAVPDGTTVLLADTALPESEPATSISVDGHQVFISDSTVAGGGPGPDDPLGPVSLRQQLLSEVALRALGENPEPLVLTLPPSWMAPLGAKPAERFFEGLDVPWLQPGTLADIDTFTSRVVPANDLSVRDEELGPQLPAENLSAARDLVETGVRLGRVVFRNDTVTDEVRDEAMASTSYAAAKTPIISLLRVTGAASFIRGQLASIRVEEPLPVTLSSETGQFGITLVNGLDQAAEIRLVAESDSEVQVRAPGRIRLQAGARTTVYPEATARALGTHYASLRVTDLAGNPTGASTVIEVRATQVSMVIWVVIGLGLVLLFSAIVLRLIRRTREALR